MIFIRHYKRDMTLDTKVHITKLKPGKVIKKNNLWLQPIEFNLTGTYENFYNLTRLIERSKKVILIKEVTFKPKKLISNKLDIILKVDVYLNI